MGGGVGVVRLPSDFYMLDEDLASETDSIKASLTRKTQQLRRIVVDHIRSEDYSAAWGSIQEFWWLRLGVHEYVYDVCFDIEDLSLSDVRDFTLGATYRKLDLSKEIPTHFADQAILHSLRYKFSWIKYACCSYDCGPITWGKDGFVPYSCAAEHIRVYWDRHAHILDASSPICDKRDFAADSISAMYNHGALYHKVPLGFRYYYEFLQNRREVYELITAVQEDLNNIVDRENLPIGRIRALPDPGLATSIRRLKDDK